MCGICGIASEDVNPASLALLQEMTRTLRHRGPDNEGFQLLDGAALGFQRLAIIDLSGGAQPMSNEDDTLWITFNGEIYNFEELRQRVEATGRHRFKTHSDTEVILHLYEEYGESCVDYLRGMFSFAIWDLRKKQLFAARDRFGKKPFFYFMPKKGGFVYASELKALAKHPECPKKVDIRAVRLYLSLQYVPAPKTIYDDVFKLPAAHCLRWSQKEGVKVRRYWQIKYEPTETFSYEEGKRRLRARLEESVRLRMISEVPLGAFLSGGMDSSVIVALMAQQSAQRVKTFSIGFEEEAYSELPYARLVAQRYKTDHHEFIVKPELIDALPKIAWFYSEPFADSSALPSFYLARETRKHVTVALNGDGGDETFAGYTRYRVLWAMAHWNLLPSAVRSMVSTVVNQLPSPDASIHTLNRLKRLFTVGASPAIDQWTRTLEILHSDDIEALWNPEHRDVLDDETASDKSLFGETLARYAPADLINKLMYLDLNHYLPDCLMVKVDIAAMANSLEARSPLLDHILAEEVARFPVDWKYRPLMNSKRILKDTFEKDLPPEILRRSKQGFGIPASQWFRGRLKDFLRDVLLSPEALARGYFDPKTVRRYVDEHQAGLKDRSPGLWALLMLELWHRAYP